MSNSEQFIGKKNVECERDAVHIAFIPVVLDRSMCPGEPFSVIPGTNIAVPNGVNPIGVIDPYLYNEYLNKGDKVLGFLNPMSVTGMRHHWSHPAFEEYKKPTKEESEAWLRGYCDNQDCPGYEYVISCINDKADGWYEINDEYFHFDERDAHGDIDPMFWYHVENLFGPQACKPKRWSCSC